MGSQWPYDVGNLSPLRYWMDNSIMPYAEALPVFQHPDGQYYPLGMGMMPIDDGEGRGYLSESCLASSFGAQVDSGSSSHEMDYISSPQNIDSIIHANTDYMDTQSKVYFDCLYSRSPVRSQPAIFNAKDYQDQILKEDRQRGWSYKRIKAVRNFNVSESTLRWRHRNLMKSSDQRPRKPTWTERDVDLLRMAVPQFTLTAGRRRVSWKAVSNFIHTHGDSPFAFAFSTCHKKWLEVTRLGNVTPSV
ncbi:hypothetical protein E4U13_005463 [Claviceps humidiphila]|uniref:Uncharacterized protein n=1 Tax=Claviceps humidiphila TaxID=1294629 RepID=A0A9P7Q0B3_9HYPO|nr:hypothetical protein E4U13_005463 [Claviceps humidiphila]